MNFNGIADAGPKYVATKAKLRASAVCTPESQPDTAFDQSIHLKAWWILPFAMLGMVFWISLGWFIYSVFAG